MPEKCIIDPARDCIGLAKAEMLEKQIDEYRRQARETHSEIFERINELEKSDSARNQQYLNIMEKLNDMSIKIAQALEENQQLKLKPGKRWESIVDKVIWAVLAAVIAFVLGKFGL